MLESLIGRALHAYLDEYVTVGGEKLSLTLLSGGALELNEVGSHLTVCFLNSFSKQTVRDKLN